MLTEVEIIISYMHATRHMRDEGLRAFLIFESKQHGIYIPHFLPNPLLWTQVPQHL